MGKAIYPNDASNHVDTVWPYWNLMDFTPEGRPAMCPVCIGAIAAGAASGRPRITTIGCPAPVWRQQSPAPSTGT